jgi:hypothetical protein
MSEWISLYVATVFPEKYITPIDFRRILTSLIFKKNLHEEGKTVVDFLHDYSHLINSSHKVRNFNKFIIILDDFGTLQ